METTLIAEKKKITAWVNSLQDKNVIAQITVLMNNSKPTYDPAYEATLTGEEKVAYWHSVGISGDELFGAVTEHIKSLPWKK